MIKGKRKKCKSISGVFSEQLVLNLYHNDITVPYFSREIFAEFSADLRRISARLSDLICVNQREKEERIDL